MNKSLAARTTAAAVLVMIGAAVALFSQPVASTGAPTNAGGAHVFVPTTVAIEDRDEPQAPTF